MQNRGKAVDPNISFDGVLIEHVKNYVYVGVNFSKNGKWNQKQNVIRGSFWYNDETSNN